MKNKRAVTTAMVWIIAIIVAILAIGGTVLVANQTDLLSIGVTAPAVEYDGEFSEGFLATKGNFYSDFSETIDCNVTSDVLGASTYVGCLYETTQRLYGNSSGINNGTEFQVDFVIDIDDDVENLEIEGDMQNTGTGQAKDDIVIKVAELWTHKDSDETEKIADMTIDNEDGEIKLDTGVLEGGEYVIHIVWKTKLVTPEFADGDDIMRMTLDLTTDEDADSGYVSFESG